MTIYNIEPWPSTYKQLDEKVKPKKLVPNIEGREVGAFRTSIPPRTVEPPQIHLIAERDGMPFQELLTGFDRSLVVAYFNPENRSYSFRKHLPGQDVIIPEFRIHWLINPHDTDLEFTCEYAPHPWDGEGDEPEFPNLATLMRFVKEKELGGKIK